MQKKLKILFLMEDLFYGGTQKQTLELASRMDKHLFEPLFLTLTGRGDLDRVAEQASIRVVNMGTGKKPAPLFFIKLAKILKNLSPDILVPCTALPNIWGRIWGTILKIPLVIGTCRGGGAPARQHERFLHRFCSHIICNSEASIRAMYAQGAAAQNLTCIPNGVDTDVFTPASTQEQQLLLCVARLCEDKDHKTLLHAFGLVAQDYPAARLRLVGSGPEEENLRVFIRQSLPPDIRKRVEFAGDSAVPQMHYAQAGIFALASIREGLPNVILEAMSSGLAVCATNVGGVPGLIRHGDNGFLSPPGDADALAANLRLCLENADKCRQAGKSARNFILENFAYSKMVKSHENLFLELWEKLGRKNAHAPTR